MFFSFLYVHVHNVIFNMILQTNYTLADLSKKPSESTFVLTYGRVRTDKNRLLEQVGFILFTTGSYQAAQWTSCKNRNAWIPYKTLV